MPALILACLIAAVVSFTFYADQQYTKDMIKFEQRCTTKGGLTLMAYKTGVRWVGCYKDGKELENE